MRRIWLTLCLFLAAGGIAVGAQGASAKTTLSLVAYSTPKDAYAKIIPAFQGSAAGKDVSINQSYGASGDQARAVAAGLSADVVALSLAPDVSTLVKKGVVPGSWTRNRQVITPNPFTSGGARWNVMAAYGAERAQGKTDKQAIDYLKKLFKNVPVLPKSAREATQVFASGKGDVLLTYENEAIYANQKGVHTEYVLPKQTILIENPIALTKSGLKHPEAKAFLKFLWSAKAQKLFGDTGYRPVVKSVARSAKYRFKQPRTLFKINSKALGLRGWKSVQFRFFNHDSGVMVKVIGR